ncbi:hypothetical protein [Exiguobacterium alkaliphilum]|uniref:Uncharacterized protein n=1 Tax=Exiguobacterium alkaliphilum TaxID=1428684 RepID=A0ABT2L1P3_9BACL|nr:hypothetical protein [Exiguobacterium alkaliphilum]MCT4795826.1 hypothetical protein [Exiguobacterium alkaliphilum]
MNDVSNAGSNVIIRLASVSFTSAASGSSASIGSTANVRSNCS